YSNTEKKMPTDLYYSCLDNSWDEDGDGVYGEAGSDSVDMGYEVIVGRIPVNTAEQADAYIDKLIALEDNPPSDIHDKFLMGGAGLGMAAWDGGTGYESDQNIAEADGHASLYAREGAINDDEAWSRRIFRNWVWGSGYQPATTGCFFSSLTSWDDAEPGDYPVSDTNMVTRFNENWNQVWWFTHGNYSLWSAGGGFSSSDALALTGHINIIATAACMTAGFDKADPCLSEAFLRNPDGGAVIYVGSSRYGLGDGIPNGVGGPSGQYGGYFFRSMLGSSTRLAGPAFAAHKRALSSYCGSNGPYRWLQFSINLQGDPAYRLRLQDTAPLQVTTPSELPTADTGAAYSTQLAATGGATPYRWTVEGGSYTEAGIAASWVAPGDAQGWQGDDDNHALDLPFAFPFYGIPYDRVIVTTNGSISFTSEAYFGGTTAGEFLSTMCIAPLWTDLATDGDADHDVYINANTERIAITWKGYLLGSSETGVHIQTVLYPDGTIDCNYKDADGISAAVGVSFGDGRTYTAGYYWGSRDDVNPILPNTSYRYTYDHNLPDGWSFSADGELSGNPTNIGKLTLTALVADDSPYPEWVRRSFTLLIDDPDNVPPTVASPASADPSVVQATTTTTLSCLGTDDGGEASLNYTWSASGGPAAVSFDTDNGTNAGKTCTATFTAAGTYTFTCTITDASLRAAHSEVVVEVQATPTTLSVTPQTAAVLTGASVAFTTTVEDQFDDTLSSQPTITWSVDSGGTIDASGVFTAGTGSDAVGSHTITASAGSLSDTATVTVLCAAPPPWIAEDIGGVGATGHTSYDSTTGTFTLTGSGADIWNDADEFHFLHRTWRGDGTVTARVASLENTHSWAKAGVMVRASTDPDSSCAMMAITPGNGATFQYRTAAGSDAASSRDDSWSAPAWVRLQRSGDTLTGSVSADGSSWTEVGTVDIPMATAVEIGLALTSHADGALAQAAFDNLSLRDERRLAIQVADGLGGLTTVVTATQGPEIHYCEEADDHDIRGLEDNADLTIDFGVPTNGG
ncbi:MAG: C25 family cysteine peptidase, partial [Planctomycetota bacterium]